jgi:secreted PhoX family phosphatase
MVHKPSSSQAIARRTFFKYIGAGSAVCALTASCQRDPGQPANVASSKESPPFLKQPLQTPPYPVPLVTDAAGDDAQRLATFEMLDAMVLPEPYEYKVVAAWGDRYGKAGHEVVFGTNNDYTGLLPIAGKTDEYYLFVSHEYLSALPWFEGYDKFREKMPYQVRIHPDPADPAESKATIALGEVQFPALKFAVDLKSRESWSAEQTDRLDDLAQRILDDLGISVLHVKRLPNHHFEVIVDSADHKRIAGHRAFNVKGANPFQFTGPASTIIKEAPVGTFGGCSGGTTSWGTFITCEENFQDVVQEFITPSGMPLDEKLYLQIWPKNKEGQPDYENGLPQRIVGQGSALKTPLDGRHYGWVCEVDPITGHMRKHTALGRFRHENVALRCETGRPLAVYMGDDRRGGHTWKFVSKAMVGDPKHPDTSRLLETGTLYVAQFQSGFKGEWLPLVPQTPLVVPNPSKSSTGHFHLPKFPEGGNVAVGEGRRAKISPQDWVASVEAFTGKPFAETVLGDLVTVPGDVPAEQKESYIQGVLVTDAFAYANAIGGTPTARPEDVEVHPQDNSVFIAYTDFTGGSDGGPDPAIFEYANAMSSKRYGGIYRVTETEDAPEATSFGWGLFVNSGEIYENGGGFACPDNLAFDAEANLWFVTDITTSAQNHPVDRQPESKTEPGDKSFPGVFGNNAMFVVPQSGPQAGQPVLFATGPTECEMTGPTFTADDKTLILSVQHPGERMGTRSSAEPSKEASFAIAGRDGKIFEQKRTLPTGSNWPDKQLDTPPRPAVISIVAKS